MKKIFLYIAITLGLLSCNHKDSLWQEIVEDLDERVETLEVLCAEMNTNITSLQTIVDVLQSNDFITSIVEIKKDGKVVGYTITFGKHDPITIYHGQDGKDGQNGTNGKDGQDGADGKDGSTPVIGVAQDTDGVYYWTLNGEWLLDDNGNKLPVSGKDGQNGSNGSNGQDGTDGKDGQDGEDGKDGADGQDGKDGITPQLKIEESYWYISYDNGATWTQLGKATGEDGKDGADGEDGKDGQNGADGKDGQDGDSMFQSVTQDENYVYFTLADGTVIKIAKGNSSNDQPNSEFIFTITYNPNGGDGVMPIDTFYYGMTKNLKNCEYTKKGHRFIGWNSNANGTGASYTDSHQVTIDKNITLYAQWQEYEAIDLGLSVLWAAFDVGATSPDEIGHLFAWGEVEPKEKSQFTWSTYKFGGYSQLTKYCTEGAYGVLDNKVTLDLEDDAANVHWGGDWRMPTVEEVTELIEKCKWSGYVYASGNGNSIHFPVYGHTYFGTMYYGYRAWSSSLSSQNSNYAKDFYVHDRDINMKLYDRERYLYGFIRPVKDKK